MVQNNNIVNVTKTYENFKPACRLVPNSTKITQSFRTPRSNPPLLRLRTPTVTAPPLLLADKLSATIKILQCHL